ncbi:MAG: hypothetical protein J1F39_01875 [Clostridiales bacterium]|nr:hypothetical protein [Clostridiales bacterium]
MEKISVFDYIDTACNVLDEHSVGFSHAADRLTEYLQTTFGVLDATVAITSRIKSRDSLKEKILRNSLYKDHPADRIVFEMHDIIGVRLECRFFRDERYLYDKIREVFCLDVGEGFFSPTGKKAVRLKLDTPQPERQKNGFDIYRIDGAVTYAGEVYKFELQIKSLVNTFWSEIEHKLIYKNIRYSPADAFMKELLNSIHEELSSVDHQLNLIFDRLNGNSVENQEAALESMLTLGLNDVYSAVLRAKLGIDISITDYSEAIVYYLLKGSTYVEEMSGVGMKELIESSLRHSAPVGTGNNNYSGLLISLLSWMRTLDYGTIPIGEPLDIKPPTSAHKEVSDVFLSNINSDFYLNTFFHILFSLERGSDNDDFADYIRYYADRILDGKTQEQAYRTIARLYAVPAHLLPLEKTIKMLVEIR